MVTLNLNPLTRTQDVDEQVPVSEGNRLEADRPGAPPSELRQSARRARDCASPLQQLHERGHQSLLYSSRSFRDLGEGVPSVLESLTASGRGPSMPDCVRG